MGFLDKIFKSPPAKQYSLAEAMLLIRNELEGLQRKNKEEAYHSALKIHDEIRHLVALIDEFSQKEVYDRAKSSAAVKERFCALAKKQFSSLGKPEMDNSLEFLQSIRQILESLGGLTQRQLLHINFFFREDFRPIAKKLKEINMLLDVAGGGGEHQKAVSIHERVEDLEKKILNLREMLMAEEERYKAAEAKASILPELPKQPSSSDMDDAESRLKSLKQEVDSFLAIQKVLKKFAYVSGLRDDLLELYVDSPSSALATDVEFQILGFVTSAVQLVNEGKIEGDRKLEDIISSADYLKRKRDALISAKHSAEEERKKFRAAQEHFEAALRARTNYMAEAEFKAKDLEKSIRELKEGLSDIESDLAKSKADLYMLASKLLNATIID